jgi:hypothetical protein
MTTPHLSFNEPDGDDPNVKTEFDIRSWGMTVSIEWTYEDDQRDIVISRLSTEQALLLREFLNRHLGG